MDQLKITVTYNDGPEKAVVVIEELVKFFGGKLEEIYKDGRVDLVITKGA